MTETPNTPSQKVDADTRKARLAQAVQQVAVPKVAGLDRVAAEAALNLDRAQRAQIQRQLTLLAYDTRGIDGTFGPETRAAIRAFQEAKGLVPDGYADTALLDRVRAAMASATGRTTSCSRGVAMRPISRRWCVAPSASMRTGRSASAWKVPPCISGRGRRSPSLFSCTNSPPTP